VNAQEGGEHKLPRGQGRRANCTTDPGATLVGACFDGNLIRALAKGRRETNANESSIKGVIVDEIGLVRAEETSRGELPCWLVPILPVKRRRLKKIMANCVTMIKDKINLIFIV